MAGDRLITLVIHTEERALRLKETLEFHGIDVVLENIDLDNMPLQIAPKRVRIREDALPLGLKILESGDLSVAPFEVIRMSGMGNSLLIPVDFSPSSFLAVKVGFYLAEKFHIEPIILHSFIAPVFNPAEPYSDSFDEPEDIDVEEAVDLRNVASRQLSSFKNKIEKAQNDGNIPAIKFSTTLLEGIPEQVISDYCKQNHPVMAVMATRGISKKSSDLIGSVTAEVIDSCRIPIFTVPENYVPLGVEGISRLVMFCTFTTFDIITMRALMRTFDFPSCEIYLVPAGDRPVSGVAHKLEELCKIFSDTYPTASFHADPMLKGKFDDNIRDLIDSKDIRLMIVPNKKSSVFSRFFRPTLAHRILFERDIPLLVLPI